MARVRSKATELARLLNSADRPVYVLDDEQTLVFCNAACLDWVGQIADELHGLRCGYHSSREVTEVEAVGAGLCPPPAAFAGEETSGIVLSIRADGRLHHRRARFIPVGGSPGEVVGLIVLVDPEDLPDDDVAAVPPRADRDEDARLHQRLQEFHHRMAGRYTPERLVGDSPPARRARAQVAVAAETRASVLLVGPPGSGRQQAARTIHFGPGAEAAGALVPLACSVLGGDLIGSTVKALAAKDPRPDRPGRSSLLLNDADQIPEGVQAELAAVLSERSFPLRLMATAGRSPLELAGQGEYRRDLAVLLGTIVIELVPLVERREDLPLLAQLLLEEINARSEKQIAGFSQEAMDRLDAYTWPGNVDELARMVAESHARAETARIGVADLPDRLHLAADAAAHPRKTEETVVLDDLLGRIEREVVGRALAKAKGNKTRAAKLLGLTRPRLYRRMVQLGLEPAEK